MTGPKQRLDQWLWFARFFKSRTLAAKLVDKGRVRVTGKIIKKASATISPEDIVTFPYGTYIRVIKIVSLATRRGPASEAQLLYEDLTPPREGEQNNGSHPMISNELISEKRPTKKQRRDIMKFKAEKDPNHSK